MLDNKGVHKNIRKIRILKGFSQEYVAKSLAVSQKHYSNLERGKVSFGPFAKYISKIFEMSITSIENFDDKLLMNHHLQITEFSKDNAYKDDSEVLKAILLELQKLNAKMSVCKFIRKAPSIGHV